MKRCRKCGDDKPLSEFHLRPLSKDGRYAVCKVCRQKKARKDYVNNRGERDADFKIVKCDVCVFRRECKDQIKMRSFTPYCFVSSKYHSFYQKEYRKEEVTA